MQMMALICTIGTHVDDKLKRTQSSDIPKYMHKNEIRHNFMQVPLFVQTNWFLYYTSKTK